MASPSAPPADVMPWFTTSSPACPDYWDCKPLCGQGSRVEFEVQTVTHPCSTASALSRSASKRHRPPEMDEEVDYGAVVVGLSPKPMPSMTEQHILSSITGSKPGKAQEEGPLQGAVSPRSTRASECLVEVVLGRRGNKECVIRYGRKGAELARVTLPSVLSTHGWTGFW
eukprot:RCo048359